MMPWKAAHAESPALAAQRKEVLSGLDSLRPSAGGSRKRCEYEKLVRGLALLDISRDLTTLRAPLRAEVAARIVDIVGEGIVAAERQPCAVRAAVGKNIIRNVLMEDSLTARDAFYRCLQLSDGMAGDPLGESAHARADLLKELDAHVFAVDERELLPSLVSFMNSARALPPDLAEPLLDSAQAKFRDLSEDDAHCAQQHFDSLNQPGGANAPTRYVPDARRRRGDA